MRRVLCAVLTSGLLAHAAVTMAAMPEPPQVFIDTDSIVSPGPTVVVPADGDLQEAINAAQPGTILVLQAGATYTGPITLPFKSGDQWIAIQSSAVNQLPGAGHRVGPQHAALMPKIVTPGLGQAALQTDPRAHHYRFIGIEFLPETPDAFVYDLMLLGSWEQTTLDEVPHHLVFDRVYVHTWPDQPLKRGIALNSATTAIINSYIAGFKVEGQDTQAIGEWNGPGPFKIVNNYLEGAGENVIFGGAEALIPDLVASDIEFRHNHVTKPLAWNINDPTTSDGSHWTVKNLFELKNAQRLLIDGNIFEHNWTDAQVGFAIVVTPRIGDGPQAVTRDITFTNNIVRHTTQGINILGSDDSGISQITERILIQNNLFDDIGSSTWGDPGNAPRLFQLLYGSAGGTNNVTITHNTASWDGLVLIMDGVHMHAGLVFNDNIAAYGYYGVFTSEGMGTAALESATTGGYTFRRNVIWGDSTYYADPNDYPADNFYPMLEDVGFVDYAGGNYRLASTSPYKGQGTDGKDPGVDMQALEAATAGVISGSPGSALLRITKAGTGSGTVTSADGGINCGSVCSHTYNLNDVVTLTATPATGSTFAGWSGTGCGSSVTMSGDRVCTAAFDTVGSSTATLTILKAGTGSGTVTSADGGIDCGTTCSHTYARGTAVKLVATPASGSTFAGWSGAGCGDIVPMGEDHTCTATFNLVAPPTATLSILKAGTGSGTVTSSDGAINCGSLCSHTYNLNDVVTLAATPSAGSTFAGWSGAGCGGTVTMSGDRVCKAMFNGAQATIYVPPGDGTLQAALDDAKPGDTLVLEAGGIYTGPVTLRNKDGEGWITLQSSALNRLPGAGQRVGPEHAALMPKIVSPGWGLPALDTEPRAHHYRLVGIEFLPQTPEAFVYDLILLGSGYPAEEGGQSTLEDVPHHLVLDRVYVHGWPDASLKRGIALNSAATEIVNSYIAEVKVAGQDTQAIGGWNGPGPFRIVNNYLEAAGENVMFGGAPPTIHDLVPSDIEVRHNHVRKPLAWNVNDPETYAGPFVDRATGIDDAVWTVKNLFELKNARRVRIDGNIFEGSWAHAQIGWALVLTPRGEDGGAPWAVVEDVTITNTIIRHAAYGIEILARDYWDDGSTEQTNRIVIRNNLWDDIGAERWGGGGWLFFLAGGTDRVVMDHNTAFQTSSVLVAGDDPEDKNTGFVFTNNIVAHNAYGIVGTGTGPGTPTLARYFPGAVVTGNVILGGPAALYPPGNAFPSSLDAVGFVDRGSGRYRLAASSVHRRQGVGVDFDALSSAMAADAWREVEGDVRELTSRVTPRRAHP